MLASCAVKDGCVSGITALGGGNSTAGGGKCTESAGKFACFDGKFVCFDGKFVGFAGKFVGFGGFQKTAGEYSADLCTNSPASVVFPAFPALKSGALFTKCLVQPWRMLMTTSGHSSCVAVC